MPIKSCKNAQNILSKNSESNQWGDSLSHQKSVPTRNGTCTCKMLGETKSLIWFELEEVVPPYFKHCLCERSGTFCIHSHIRRLSISGQMYLSRKVIFMKCLSGWRIVMSLCSPRNPVSGVNDTESKHKICYSRAGIHSYWIKLNIETLVAAGVQYFSSLLQQKTWKVWLK